MCKRACFATNLIGQTKWEQTGNEKCLKSEVLARQLPVNGRLKRWFFVRKTKRLAVSIAVQSNVLFCLFLPRGQPPRGCKTPCFSISHFWHIYLAWPSGLMSTPGIIWGKLIAILDWWKPFNRSVTVWIFGNCFIPGIHVVLSARGSVWTGAKSSLLFTGVTHLGWNAINPLHNSHPHGQYFCICLWEPICLRLSRFLRDFAFYIVLDFSCDFQSIFHTRSSLFGFFCDLLVFYFFNFHAIFLMFLNFALAQLFKLREKLRKSCFFTIEMSDLCVSWQRLAFFFMRRSQQKRGNDVLKMEARVQQVVSDTILLNQWHSTNLSLPFPYLSHDTDSTWRTRTARNHFMPLITYTKQVQQNFPAAHLQQVMDATARTNL